jgi:hypothetical protein
MGNLHSDFGTLSLVQTTLNAKVDAINSNQTSLHKDMSNQFANVTSMMEGILSEDG